MPNVTSGFRIRLLGVGPRGLLPHREQAGVVAYRVCFHAAGVATSTVVLPGGGANSGALERGLANACCVRW